MSYVEAGIGLDMIRSFGMTNLTQMRQRSLFLGHITINLVAMLVRFFLVINIQLTASSKRDIITKLIVETIHIQSPLSMLIDVIEKIRDEPT